MIVNYVTLPQTMCITTGPRDGASAEDGALCALRRQRGGPPALCSVTTGAVTLLPVALLQVHNAPRSLPSEHSPCEGQRDCRQPLSTSGPQRLAPEGRHWYDTSRIHPKIGGSVEHRILKVPPKSGKETRQRWPGQPGTGDGDRVSDAAETQPRRGCDAAEMWPHRSCLSLL